MVVRLGDADFSATSSVAGVALPVYLDYFSLRPTVARFMTLPLPTSEAFSGTDDAPGPRTASACTLAMGSQPSLWNFEQEGFPSNSGDGAFGLLPCYNVPVGEGINGGSPKTIATFSRAQEVNTLFTGFISSVTLDEPGAVNGWRQVASQNGVTRFYTSSVAAFDARFRYIADPTAVAEDGSFVSRQIFPTAASSTTIKAGAKDARGISIFDGKLYATCGSADTGFDAIFFIGSALPTVATNSYTKVATVAGLSKPWTFVFADANRLFVAVERTTGTKGVVQLWTKATTTFTLTKTITFSTTLPVRSIASRIESNSPVVYGVTKSALYRYDSASTATSATLLASAAADQAFRGVLFAGMPLSSPSRSNSPTRSKTPSRTKSRTKTRTKSKTGTRKSKKVLLA